MKRSFIVAAIIAVVSFITYNALFADRHLRLKVEANKSMLSADLKVAKDSRLSFEVRDIQTTRTSVNVLLRDYHGYLSSEIMQGDRVDQVVRVPTDHLEDFITKATALGNKTLFKTLSTNDLTDEFIDKEAHLATQKELEKRYINLLQKALKVEDILQIEKELAKVRGEIETMEGQRRNLVGVVAFSTLNLIYLFFRRRVDVRSTCFQIIDRRLAQFTCIHCSGRLCMAIADCSLNHNVTVLSL
jgi:hypothetical protein